MKMKDLRRRWAKHTVAIGKAIESDLPRLIGQRLVPMYKQNFMDESFFGTRWKEVQRRSHPRRLRSGRLGAASRRRILTGETGNLGRSIHYRAHTASVTVYSDVPYAAYHNGGTARLARRQFLGQHKRVSEAVERAVREELTKILKQR